MKIGVGKYYVELGAKKLVPQENLISNKPGRTDYVVKLEQQFKFRTQQDILTWRMALQAAENIAMPMRRLLYDLFDELLLDNHTSGLIYNTLLARLLAEPSSMVNGEGEVNHKLTAAFKAMWFEEYTTYVVEAEMLAHSLIQATYNNSAESPGVNIALIPRRNVRPETGEILYSPYEQNGFDYVNDKTVNWCLVEVGKPEDLGLLVKAAPMIIIKKFGLTNWSQFAELFGMPMRVATIMSKDPKDLDRVEGVLRDMGTAAYAVFSEGEKYEVKESNRTDAYKVYDALMERCNGELSKLITGVTLPTDSGVNGSRSLGEVQQITQDAVLERHKRRLEYITNGQLIPKLIAQGWTELKGHVFKHNEAQDLDALWKRTSEALTHYDVEPEFIERTFGIPVTPKKQPEVTPGQEEDQPPGKK